MKKKSLSNSRRNLILGTLFMGAVSIIVSRRIVKHNGNTKKDKELIPKVDNDIHILQKQKTFEDVSLINEKVNISNKISERHKIASNIVEESLLNINSESIDSNVYIDKNETKLNDMLKELSELSK